MYDWFWLNRKVQGVLNNFEKRWGAIEKNKNAGVKQFSTEKIYRSLTLNSLFTSVMYQLQGGGGGWTPFWIRHWGVW